MAKNLDLKTELKGILQDVARHRFKTNRQVNPKSQLFQTVKLAIDKGYLEQASYEENPNRLLADINLAEANLSKLGQKKLIELTNLEE